MAFQHGLFSLVLSTLLLAPAAARATDVASAGDEQQATPPANGEVSALHAGDGQEAAHQGWGGGYGEGSSGDFHAEHHVHTGSCHHPPPPPPPRWRRHPGRYELQTVQTWVPGRYEQVWVDRVCTYEPHCHTPVCRGGYYEKHWVPGYYKTVQEWVWVPARPPYGAHRRASW